MTSSKPFSAARRRVLRTAAALSASSPFAAMAQLRSRVELIIAAFNQSILAASAATTTIPIIMFGALVPVELGWADSLARPGRNLTGTTYFAPETTGKLLELLKETRPGVRKVAVLTNPEVPGKPFYQPMYHRAAAALGLSVQFFEAARPEEITSALQRIAASGSDALYNNLKTAQALGVSIPPALRARADRFLEASEQPWRGAR